MATALSASLVPLTLGMDAMRQLCFEAAAGTGVMPVHWELAALAALAILFLGLSVKSLEYLEHLGRKSGRLTMKWQ
jgi:ABC-2 type transport system permease protein